VRGFAILAAILLGGTATAAAQYALSPPTGGAEAPSACQLRLAKVAEFRPLSVLAGPGACGAGDAVLLQSLILPDQTTVTVVPPATLRCTMAEAVALWVREDVTPATLKLGGQLQRLDELDSYDCRGRNGISGAGLSEHGLANAFDVGDFRLAGGKVLGLTDVHVAKAWREALRASACARFSTVLGPGSDGYHEEHVHLDLAERHGRYKMCQWDVREPIEDSVPLPRPRPAVSAEGDEGNSQSSRLGTQLR
jgi:hypothetical protein